MDVEHYEDTRPDEDRNRSAGEQREVAGTGDEALPAFDGSTILLVEDDALTRQAFELVFSYYGAHVLSAASTAEALVQYEHATPSILVSDIGLPDCDGCVLLRTIRAREHASGTPMPAIAMSGSLGADANRRAHAAGYDLYMVKPINISVLLHAMHNLLERRR